MLGHCYRDEFIYAHQSSLTSLLIYVLGYFTDSESETRKTVVKELAPMKDKFRTQYVVQDNLNRIRSVLFDGVSDIDSRCQITYVLWLE